MRTHLGAVGLGLAVAALGLSVRAQEAGAAPFSTAERRALVGGELVRRPVTRVEGPFRFLGGTSYMRVRAPRDRVFAELLDTTAYPRLIPGVAEARLVEDAGDRRVVYLRHQVSFVSAAYHAVARVDRPARSIRFDLDRSRPNDVRAGRGFITVDAYRGDQSIVTWGVMADPGSAILGGVFGGVIADWILLVPWCVRGRLEAGQPGC
ncbi:MAG: SRPBCC family protein [Sandaracinaceae bacterium]|nr:SRPBCC family protein [Sandaracinaceae bacterium]